MEQRARKTAFRRGQISREIIVEAAAVILAAEGLPGLTMRRIAERLGVEAMSLYNHVANKDDMLDGMVDLVFDEIGLPPAAVDWRAAMREASDQSDVNPCAQMLSNISRLDWPAS